MPTDSPEQVAAYSVIVAWLGGDTTDLDVQVMMDKSDFIALQERIAHAIRGAEQQTVARLRPVLEAAKRVVSSEARHGNTIEDEKAVARIDLVAVHALQDVLDAAQEGR